jgi:hypothetical protein
MRVGFARRMCRAGGKVGFVDVRGTGHETTADDTKELTLDLIDARFAGTDAVSNCGKF